MLKDLKLQNVTNVHNLLTSKTASEFQLCFTITFMSLSASTELRKRVALVISIFSECRYLTIHMSLN